MDAELIQPQAALFDYESLESEARIVIQQRASEIKTLAKRVAADIVEIGGKLAEVKDRLGGNGKFSAWLHGELGWSDRTALNFIVVYQKFESQDLALENFATSALYLLAAPSTPAEAVEAAKQIAAEGEKVTHTTAKQLVERAKAKRPKQVALVDPVRPEPVGEEDGEAVSVGYVTEEEGEPEETVTYVDGGGVSHHRIPAPTPEPALTFASVPPAQAAPAILTIPAAAETPKPAAWRAERIEISIALMPCEGPGEERKILYAVQAGERTPFYGMAVGEGAALALPAKAQELVEKLLASLAAEPAPAKAAPKSTAKKPARKAAKAKTAGKK